MPDNRTTDKTGQIPTNLRLLVLLEEVARTGEAVTPSAVNEVLRLPKPTVHRLFRTAETEGFLQRDIDGRSYHVGPRLRRLSVNTLTSERARTVRFAVLTRLAEEIGETCNIATPDRCGMFYLDRVETQWPLRIQLPIGTLVPFHCTASGKMYLSSLKPSHIDPLLRNYTLKPMTGKTIADAQKLKEEISLTRSRGYSTDNEEFMAGMIAVAVPIFGERERLLSTLSVHAPVQRHSLEGMKRHLPILMKAARELSQIASS